LQWATQVICNRSSRTTKKGLAHNGKAFVEGQRAER